MRGIAAELCPDGDFLFAGTLDELNAVLAEDRAIDLVSLDLVFPGFELERDLPALRERLPIAAIVAVTMLSEPGIVDKVLKHGVNGFISKSAPAKKMLDAFRLVLEGDVVVEADFTPVYQTGGDERLGRLSPRHKDVLRLISKGMTNKEIALDLGISPSTVRMHVSAILEILSVPNRSGAAAIASKAGL